MMRRIITGLFALLVMVNTSFAQGEDFSKLSDNEKAKEYNFSINDSISYKVVFYQSDVFRLMMAKDGNFADPLNNPEEAQIILDFDSRAQNVKLDSAKNTISFSTKDLTLIFNKKKSTFELKNADNKTIWKELKPISIGDSTTTQYLSSTKDTYFYGGGQQNGYFSHKGKKIDIVADGNWDEGGHPNPAPFFMTNKGYGVLRHTFSPGYYDFTRDNEIDLTHYEKRFDAYFFIGDSFNKILDLYTQFTGRPNFVTIWALELGEADAYMTRDSKTKELLKNEDGSYVEITPDVVPRLAEQYRKHDFPCGWILPNDGYGCGYVDLPEVVKNLDNLGFHTGLWTEGELVKTKWEVGTAGTRVQKLDVAWTWPAYQFSLNANKQAWNSLTKNSETRGFVWTVQGWAGTQRYAVCWTGDQFGSWDLIRYHIPTLTGSGMSGQAYATTDVDGIFGGSAETYTRDLQWKCFTPVLYAMNGWAATSKSPWAFEEPYISINRDYLKLKMRLTPYMYKYTKEANETGAPIVRAMVWNYPNDKHTWGPETQYQYMLGDWMLIAPVFTSMNTNNGWRTEDIYLPEGQWIDYADGRKIEGPYTIDNYPITLEKLPIFIKAGAIIPMYPEMLYNNQKPKDPLTFDVYPYGKSEFRLYEDDGITKKYQNGEFAHQIITCDAPKGIAGDIEIKVGASDGDFDGKLSSRVYQFQIHSELEPDSITFNGNSVLELKDKGAYNTSKTSWYFDKNDKRGIVHVRLPRYSTDKELTLKVFIHKGQKIEKSPAYPLPPKGATFVKSEFKVTTNSQMGTTLTSAFDGTPETYWFTNYWPEEKVQAKKHPYIVNIDINDVHEINGFGYMNRVDGGQGKIKDFEIYVSNKENKFGEPVLKGTFEDKPGMQNVFFKATKGQYVKFVALSSYDNSKYASAAEFEVYTTTNPPKKQDVVVFLSSLKPSSSKGEFSMDKSIGGNELKVNGKKYKKGIGAKSGSEIVFTLDGSWEKLTGNVGMDDEVGRGGSVMFRVYGDGKLLFESPEMDGDNVKQLMALTIKGVKELKFVLDDLGDGSKNDHGDWVDVKLIK